MDKTSSQPSTPARAESFYFDDDPMAIFLVVNQLFKVHRHYFIEGSQIFRDMFSQASSCEEAEGMSDDKPIVLPNVTLNEFKTLLRYFYAMKLPMPSKKVLADILAFKKDEKLALFSIAHKFVFDNIFEYISGEFEPETFPVVDRVRLGDRCGLKIWLSSAYNTILERTPGQRLSQEEADALGFERAVKLLEAKNSILHKVHGDHLADLQSRIQCRCSVLDYQRPCLCCTLWSNDLRTLYPVTKEIEAVAQAVEELLL